MSDEQIIQFLQDNIDYMINNDIILWLFRTLGWVVAKGMAMLIGIGKDLYDVTYGLVDVTSWSGMDAWINEFKPLVSIIMVASLAALGAMYMFGKNKKHNVLYSILLFGVIVTSSTYLFSTFNTWAVSFKDGVVGEDGIADGADLINASLYDLLYIDDQIGLKNMTDGNRPQYSILTDQEIDYIKITEVMDWDDAEDSDTKDILKKRLQYRAEGSKLQDVSNGVAWTSIGNDLYFRYKFHFATFYLDALAVLLLYFCLAYKNVRITYELLIGRVLVLLKAPDISSSKKLVKLLEAIKDEYIALCFTAITIRSYFVFTEYIKQVVEQTGGNEIVKVIISLFVAFCVIDGSNIMQRMTGVDAGLSSMTGKLLAGMHLAQGVANAAYQRRLMHAMNGSAGEKSSKSKQGKGIEEGDRIGIMQFGKRQKNMDQDLSQEGETEQKKADHPENAGDAKKMSEEMENQNGHQGEKNGQPDGAGGAGTAETMENDLQSEGGEENSTQTQEDETLYGNGGTTEQMDQDLEGHSSFTSGSTKDGMNQQEAMSRENPENNMFQRWKQKQASKNQNKDGDIGSLKYVNNDTGSTDQMNQDLSGNEQASVNGSRPMNLRSEESNRAKKKAAYTAGENLEQSTRMNQELSEPGRDAAKGAQTLNSNKEAKEGKASYPMNGEDGENGVNEGYSTRMSEELSEPGRNTVKGSQPLNSNPEAGGKASYPVNGESGTNTGYSTQMEQEFSDRGRGAVNRVQPLNPQTETRGESTSYHSQPAEFRSENPANYERQMGSRVESGYNSTVSGDLSGRRAAPEFPNTERKSMTKIHTTGNRSAMITEGKSGKDRYVGGEAVPKESRRKNSKKKEK